MCRLNGVAPKLEVECQSELQRGRPAGIDFEGGEAEGELRTSRWRGEKGRGTVNGRYHEDEDHKGKCSIDDGRQSSPEAFRGTPRFTA
jgi:hypothetical protein